MSEFNFNKWAQSKISYDTWDSNYRAPGEETPEDSWKREARACASVEKEEIREQVEQDFLWLLDDFKGNPGGRISANLGVEGRNSTTLLNCYFLEPTKKYSKHPADSLAGIFEQLDKQSQTLKSEGGYGTNFSYIRPSGSYVDGIGGRTPGVLKFMELWDKSSEIITMGSEKVIGGRKKGEKKKIRKGAQMSIFDSTHPEIFEYVDAKLTPNRLTKFNLSVGINEGFMNAVENDLDWELVFPDTSFEKYDTEWFGDIDVWKSKGYPVVIHETVRARDLWEKIMKATYTRNDPGVLFLDLCNKLSPISYSERIRGTNPCFTGDMRFLTEKGYRTFASSEQDGDKNQVIYYDNRISYVNENHVVHASANSKLKLSIGSSARITDFDQKIIELKFDNGYKVKCTPNHKFATTEGMIEAKDLTSEHKVLISIPNINLDYNNSIDFEDEILIQSFLAGIIVAGAKTYTDYKFGIDTENNNFNIEIKNLLNKLSDSGIEWLKDVNKDIVPNEILEEARAGCGHAFICGFLKNNINGLKSSNENLLTDIQLILSANGIGSSIVKTGIGSVRKKDKTEVFPFELVVSNKQKDYFISRFKSTCLISYKDINDYTSVISVSECENETVYCLTEPVSHSFICQGLAVSNCGEIAFSSPGVCLLFSLNLVKFVTKNALTNKFEFDFETFRKAVSTSVRFADNINDITRTPLPEYKDALLEKRRIGIGVLALGSLLFMLGMKYGSKESQKLVDDIFKIKCEEELLASAKLGKEKGSFPLFDREKFFNTYYWKTLQISPEVKKQIEEIGEMRNSHRSANAPTGNMSITVGGVSGGIEPVFLKEYTRWVTVVDSERIALKEQGFEFPNPLLGEWFETSILKTQLAGKDEILKGVFNGVQYQVDKSRGLTKAELIQDYGWKFVKENYSQEEIKQLESEGVFATTEELTVHEHIDILKIIAKYTDQNSSKTVNLPNDYPYEDFKNLYMDAWKSGIKGITTYRAGTMMAVLESTASTQKDEVEVVSKAVDISRERPKKLQSETHKVKIEAGDEVKNAYVTISFADQKQPYEVFINTPVGDNLKDTQILELTSRLSSLAMRNNVPLEDIIDQLQKVDGQFIYSIPNTLSKVLNEYVHVEEGSVHSVCPSCGEKTYVKKDGCTLCLSCSYSACS